MVVDPGTCTPNALLYLRARNNRDSTRQSNKAGNRGKEQACMPPTTISPAILSGHIKTRDLLAHQRLDSVLFLVSVVPITASWYGCSKRQAITKATEAPGSVDDLTHLVRAVSKVILEA